MWKYYVIAHWIIQTTTTTAHNNGFEPGRQNWGFSEVRQGAHMFWWLYFVTDSDVDHYSERPIVIWLQGGPGGSSTGYGNFEEIGPLDLDLHERPHTWVKYFNVLFIDNPVGTGYSHVDDATYLSKNNEEIAQDLVNLMRQFYETFPEFRKTPLHIFSESYGGKMAVQFAYQLHLAVKDGSIVSNLRSVALGAPWISPEDSVMSWGEFLLNLGFVDTKGFGVIHRAAKSIRVSMRDNQTKVATDIWRSMQHIVTKEAIGIDCYNVLKPQRSISAAISKVEYERLHFGEQHQIQHDIIMHTMDSSDKLNRLMRGPVSDTLGIPNHVLWGSQKDMVFAALFDDFMKPTTQVVETLLNTTELDVIIYTGQLDLVVSTPGTVRWVEKLQWPGREGYLNAPRHGIDYRGVLEGYEKNYGKLTMYWIDRAGHMAPVDNHMAIQYILDKHVIV